MYSLLSQNQVAALVILRKIQIILTVHAKVNLLLFLFFLKKENLKQHPQRWKKNYKFNQLFCNDSNKSFFGCHKQYIYQYVFEVSLHLKQYKYQLFVAFVYFHFKYLVKIFFNYVCYFVHLIAPTIGNKKKHKNIGKHDAMLRKKEKLTKATRMVL